MKQLKALLPNLKSVGTYSDEWGYDPVLTIDPANIDRDAARQALALVNATCEPASEPVIISELAKLGYKTKARAEDAGDAKMRLLAYAEELAEFPADVIRSACRSIARCETFFPAISELRAACHRAMRMRSRLKDDLARALR